MAATLLPLAFIPFGINAAGMLAFGLGLIARDGLLAAVGYAAAGVTGI